MRPQFFADCRTYGVPLAQCPSFLFLILGGFTIVAMVSTHLVASRYTEEPQVATLIVIGVTLVMLLIGQVIVASFRRLAEASAAKSEFVSIASHQLRTPLSAIKWAGALLADGRGVREYIDIIRDNTERMVALVNDLLDVNRIESGTLPLKRERISLERIARQALARLEPFARASNITLDVRLPEDLPEALGDPERVRMALENLIDNAVRYATVRGKVEVSIAAERGTLTCRVADKGVGIAAPDQCHVFEKFFRAKNALKHQTVGSGLGLFIAKAIIQGLGGKIGFTSEEGKGSTFWFTLPMAEK